MNTYTAQQVTYGQAFVNTILAALKTVPGAALIVAGKLRLSNNPTLVLTPQTTIAALAANECAYSGYTAGGIAVVLSAPLNLSNNAQGVLTTGLFLAVTATPYVPDTATGWWIDDGTNFIVGERFAGNQVATFAAPGAFLDLIAELPIQLGQATS